MFTFLDKRKNRRSQRLMNQKFYYNYVMGIFRGWILQPTIRDIKKPAATLAGSLTVCDIAICHRIFRNEFSARISWGCPRTFFFCFTGMWFSSPQAELDPAAGSSWEVYIFTHIFTHCLIGYQGTILFRSMKNIIT